MKKLLASLIVVFSCITLMAQPPQGGGMGGGNRPPGGPGGPPMGENRDFNPEIGIMKMPEIPDMTDKQRQKLTKNIIREQKEVTTQMADLHALKIEMESTPGLSDKEKEKLQKKMDKIDEKMKKTREKYDKKYRSILTDNQYEAFTAKKNEIQFRQPGPGRMQGPPPGENGERPQRGTPPQQVESDMDIF